MNQIKTLYILNLHNVICVLYLNRTRKKYYPLYMSLRLRVTKEEATAVETLLDNDKESREVEMSVKTPTGSLPEQVDRNLTKSRRRYRSKTSARFF